jgi:chemotaxis protein methyltransferase WspC
MTQIEQLLREKIGLDPASVGSSSIERIVRLRMKSLGIKEPQEYAGLLSKLGAEWKELVEGVVVTETWFFRDHEPFDAFVRFVREAGLLAHAGRLRILSMPCASGEEPYSLAISLIEAGLPLDKFHIDAADISARALACAKRAVYGRNSFRGNDLAFRDRYFQPSREGYVLDPTVRSAVHFSEGNLLDPGFLANKGHYDFIFCRNLLIYFDRDTQARALQTVNRLLASSGILMTGAAEQPIALENHFVSAHVPMAFACRKASASPTDSARHSRSTRALQVVPPQPPAFSPPVLPAITPPASPRSFRFERAGPAQPSPRPGARGPLQSAVPEVKSPARELEAARRLADAGHLDEAAIICETYLRANTTSAQAWYLLGVIREAASDPSARECYRKALYLDPNHYETLLQMAWLSEQGGDIGRALGFRTRAIRAKNTSNLNRDSFRA